LRFLRAFAQFWYDFIIGDDWKIAFAVACAVALSIALMSMGLLNDAILSLVGGALVIAGFSISLVVDVRRRR
jgi:hypothetical protein